MFAAICRKSSKMAGPQFLTKVVTGDESWCYGHDAESKQQSRQWKSPNLPRPIKGRQVHSSVKTVLISLSLSPLSLPSPSPLNGGTGHREMVPAGQAVNQQFYLNALQQFLESLQ